MNTTTNTNSDPNNYDAVFDNPQNDPVEEGNSATLKPIYIADTCGDPAFHHPSHTPQSIKEQRDALTYFLCSAVPTGPEEDCSLAFQDKIISPKTLPSPSPLLFGYLALPLLQIPNTAFLFPLPTLHKAITIYRSRLAAHRASKENPVAFPYTPTPDPVEILRVLVNRAYNPTASGVPGRQRAVSARKEEIKRMYNKGLAAEFIAQAVGTSRATIYDTIKRMRNAREYGLASHAQHIAARRSLLAQVDDTIASELGVVASEAKQMNMPAPLAANYKNVTRQQTKHEALTMAAVDALKNPVVYNASTSTTIPTNPQEIDAAYNRKVADKVEAVIEAARANDKGDEPVFDRDVIMKRIAGYQQVEDECMTSREKLEVTMCIVARASLLPVLEQRARQKVEEYAALHDGSVDADDENRIDYDPPLMYLDRMLRVATFKPAPLPQWEDE